MLSIFIIGCGEEKEQESQKENRQPSVSKVEQAPKIEITANENAQEIKVKEKKIDKAQSKSYYYDYNIKSEYDSNAMPANEDASVRAKPRTTIDANINVRSPYEKVQISMLVKKLSKTFRVKCSACHDDYANGIIGPSLLARDSDFIYNTIADFKSGKKSNPLMDDLVHMMSDDEIRTLASEIFIFNQEVKKIRESR
jgi:cytochrome c553